MKNYSDTIENRTRDLPACSAVPEPTEPPRPRLIAVRKIRGELFCDFISQSDPFYVLAVVILYNQRDATYTMFFIIISALYVSGGFSTHHQELIKLCAALVIVIVDEWKKTPRNMQTADNNKEHCIIFIFAPCILIILKFFSPTNAPFY